MNEEINKIIDSLEGCIGMFDYMITPIESNLLVSYIRELQQENKQQKEVIDRAINYIVKETKSMPTNGCKIRLIKLLDILEEGKNEWDMETYKRFWKYIWNI